LKIILHGVLKDQYPEMEVGADTVAEAIEGWSRQTTMHDLPFDERPLIEVIGFTNEKELYKKTDVKEIHLVPSMFGGGGPVGKIIIGSALIVAGILLMPYIGPTFSMALIAPGISMVVGGIMQAFMKSPTVSKSEDPEASKYLGSGDDTTEIGTLFSKGYGRMKLGIHYMSVQVNSNDMVFGKFPTTVPA
jgi:predicted phage tail protein